MCCRPQALSSICHIAKSNHINYCDKHLVNWYASWKGFLIYGVICPLVVGHEKRPSSIDQYLVNWCVGREGFPDIRVICPLVVGHEKRPSSVGTQILLTRV